MLSELEDNGDAWTHMIVDLAQREINERYLLNNVSSNELNESNGSL